MRGKKKSRRRFIASKLFKPVNQGLTEECSSDSFATKLSAFSYWLEKTYIIIRKEFYKNDESRNNK